MKNIYWRYAGFAVLGIIIGFGIGRVSAPSDMFGNIDELQQELDGLQDGTGTSTETTAIGSRFASLDTIIVTDQKAGARVVVDGINVSQPVWVVVSEDSNGRPARILGAQVFKPGEYIGEVALLRATIPGNVYHAIIYTDNGDGVFDYKEDSPMKPAQSGEGLVEAVFKAQ